MRATASRHGLAEDVCCPLRCSEASSAEQDPFTREDRAGPLTSLNGTLISLRWQYGGVAELGEHCGGGEDSMGKVGGVLRRRMTLRRWTKWAKKIQFSLAVRRGSFTNVLFFSALE